MATTIQLRRDIAANWTAVNPVLANGEPGVETDTGILKIGNGTDAWEDLQGISGAGGGGGMEIGTIYAHGGTAAPIGSLVCDGTAYSRTDYADLFAAIGTTWGAGDGSTTFNVPDLRGAFVRGTGSHGTETMADGNPFAGPAVGAFEDDQFQGHHHNFAPFSGGPADGLSTYETNNSGGTFVVGAVAGGVNNTVDSPITDGTNGTPRTGDETRPFAAGVTYCIKATPATNSGTPLPTYSYSTGWVANSDWTNAEFTVTHGLNAPLSDLIVKFFISTDGTEANARQVDFHVNVDNASSATGCTGYAINDSSFKIQTGASGVDFVNETGARFNVNTESYYYKVKVYRPEVLATELAVTKYDTGWVANSDWTAMSLTITHNLGKDLQDLIVEAFVSSSSNGSTNTTKVAIGYTHFEDQGDAVFGSSILPVDSNSFNWVSMQNGMKIVNGAAVETILDNDAWYYRVVVYAPNLLENAQPAAVKSLSANYAITGRTDSPSFLVTTGATDRTVTLPAGSGMIPGDEFEIVKVDSGTGKVTVSRAGSDTIEGLTSKDVVGQDASIKVRWSGSTWQVTGSRGARPVANAVRVGSHEYVFTEDNQLDISSSFTNGVDADITVSQLPSNTREILLFVNVADTGTSPGIQFRRTAASVVRPDMRAAFADRGINSIKSSIWVGTNSNAFWAGNVDADTTLEVRVLGYKVAE